MWRSSSATGPVEPVGQVVGASRPDEKGEVVDGVVGDGEAGEHHAAESSHAGPCRLRRLTLVTAPVTARDALPRHQRHERPAWLSQNRAAMCRACKTHTGFEPVSSETEVPEPLRRELDELRAQSAKRGTRSRADVSRRAPADALRGGGRQHCLVPPPGQLAGCTVSGSSPAASCTSIVRTADR